MIQKSKTFNPNAYLAIEHSIGWAKGIDLLLRQAGANVTNWNRNAHAAIPSPESHDDLVLSGVWWELGAAKQLTTGYVLTHECTV